MTPAVSVRLEAATLWHASRFGIRGGEPRHPWAIARVAQQIEQYLDQSVVGRAVSEWYAVRRGFDRRARWLEEYLLRTGNRMLPDRLRSELAELGHAIREARTVRLLGYAFAAERLAMPGGLLAVPMWRSPTGRPLFDATAYEWDAAERRRAFEEVLAGVEFGTSELAIADLAIADLFRSLARIDLLLEMHCSRSLARAAGAILGVAPLPAGERRRVG